MMDPPKRLALRAREPISFDISILLTCNFAGENRSRPRPIKQVCEKWTLTETK
jgi:hypothetical protein